MSATTGEFIALVKPLDEFSDHRLHPEAVDKVFAVYQASGGEAAKRVVRLMKDAFRDVQNDSYITPEVMSA